MARERSGTIHVHQLADETRAFHLRVRVGGQRVRVVLHERPGCECGCGGGWDEPAARRELGNIIARVRVGVWTPPEPPPAEPIPDGAPTFHAYACWWLQAKIDGTIGTKGGLAANTIHVDLLAAILDEAIEDGHLAHNPARGRRMRLHVPRPRRSFLEMDELAALLDAATAQDAPFTQPPKPSELGPTARLIAHLLATGLTPTQVARRLNVSKGTVGWHMRRLGANHGRGYVGRRVVCEILGRAGVRASELCAIRVGHVRLHDPDGARFLIPDSKTEAGIREVQMTPDLVEAVIDHIDRLRRAGRPTEPDAYLVPNLNGGPMNRHRVGEIVREAAQHASRERTENGLPPLPHITPHSLRRTYISIALLANNYDVKWVMSQVGHADSKMTMDVYAQLEQRVKRDHGRSFDRLVRQARAPRSGPERSRV